MDVDPSTICWYDGCTKRVGVPTDESGRLRQVYADIGGTVVPICLVCLTNFATDEDYSAHMTDDGKACTGQMDHRFPPDGWTVDRVGQAQFGVSVFRKDNE